MPAQETKVKIVAYKPRTVLSRWTTKETLIYRHRLRQNKTS